MLTVAVDAITALDVPRETAERIHAWTVELTKWQKAQRLVGWKRPQELLDEGIADAVAAAQLVGEVPGPWVDLGSGNGLPGLILAAAHPDREVHLVEARRKRCAFLKAAARAMGLGKVAVHNARAEDLLSNPDCPKPTLLSARAFVPPEQLPGHAEAWGATWLLASSSRARLPKGRWPEPWTLHVERPGRPAPDRLHLLLKRI